MIYNDRVYGKVDITDPVALEIMHNPFLQRLKGVDQAGYKPLWVKKARGISIQEHNRYNHSVGVYLLLLKYRATLEERIAGLIHDVSHSVFSHFIDYIYSAGLDTQNYQDSILENFIRNTDIPDICKTYSLDINFILNDSNFPLKERLLPALCADRIDYSLRDAVILGEIDQKEATYYLNNLLAEDRNWVFKDYKSAKKYSELFSKLNKVYYAGLDTAVMFQALGDYIKHALQKGYIENKDLYTTDEQVLLKIKVFVEKDETLRTLFKRMNGQIHCANNPKNYDVHVFCKSRVVNPLCIYKGMLKSVSDIDPAWGKLVQEELKSKEYYLKFEESST